MQDILSGDSCCGHAAGPTWTIVSYRVYINAIYKKSSNRINIGIQLELFCNYAHLPSEEKAFFEDSSEAFF